MAPSLGQGAPGQEHPEVDEQPADDEQQPVDADDGERPSGVTPDIDGLFARGIGSVVVGIGSVVAGIGSVVRMIEFDRRSWILRVPQTGQEA